MDHDRTAGSGALARLVAGVQWRRDVALPALLLVVQIGFTAASARWQLRHGSHLDVVDWLLLAVGPVALVFRRRHPVVVMWVAFAATLTHAGARAAYFSLIVAFFVAAIGGHRRAAWSAIVVGYVTAVWLSPLLYGGHPASLAFALGLFGWLTVLVVVAEVVRMSSERRLQERATRELEQRRRAGAARLQMARDLHDVIGHTISLINVQAGAGLDLMDHDPEQARSALAAIRSASKDALEELRAMLAALRDEGEHAPRSPARGLDRLPELVEAARSAGLSVTTDTTGQSRQLPAAVDLAAYRIVQESLTNVARHAPTATVVVRLAIGPSAVDVEVLDDGGRAPRAAAAVAGSGITGMRERAAALGGQLDAGPRAEGGFAVRAHLPVPAPADAPAHASPDLAGPSAQDAPVSGANG